MAADASIYSMIKPAVALPDPLEQYGRQLKISSLMDESSLNQLKRRELEKGIARDDALSSAVQTSGGDPAKVRQAFIAAGDHKGLAAWEKAQLETQQTRGNIDKTKLESFGLAAKQMRDAVATVNDDAGMVMLKENAMRLFGPDIAGKMQIPDRFDPNWKQRQLMTADKLLESLAPKMQTVNLGGRSALVETNPNAPGFNANVDLAHTATPGDLLTDKRGNAALAETRRHHGATETQAANTAAAGRAPAGYRYKPDGLTLEIIPGGPAEKDKALTEVQGKATAFSMRQEDSAKVIDQLEKTKGFDPAAITTQWAGQTGLNAPMNYFASANAQKYEQAKRNWVTANLRLESGAAIPDAELAQEYRKWFPIIGDGKEVIAQKAAARKVAEQAIRVQAGPGLKKIPTGTTGAGTQTTTGQIGGMDPTQLSDAELKRELGL
jgi:hypothetical protein